MSAAAIARYLVPAAFAALAAAAAWTLFRWRTLRAQRARPHLYREALKALFAAYLAALVEIIALRFGEPHAARSLKLVPLQTTLAQLQGGAWSFVYHTLGNVIWFVPLGMLAALLNPRLRARTALLLGAGTSALLELAQYLLASGVTDIDDIWLNALGALGGWALARAIAALRRRFPTNPDHKEG